MEFDTNRKFMQMEEILAVENNLLKLMKEIDVRKTTGPNKVTG